MINKLSRNMVKIIIQTSPTDFLNNSSQALHFFNLESKAVLTLHKLTQVFLLLCFKLVRQ